MFRSKTILASALVLASISAASAQDWPYYVPANYRTMEKLTNGQCPLVRIDKSTLYYGRPNFEVNMVVEKFPKHYISRKLAEFDKACGKR